MELKSIDTTPHGVLHDQVFFSIGLDVEQQHAGRAGLYTPPHEMFNTVAFSQSVLILSFNSSSELVHRNDQ
jgi:hypothetical protein